MIAFYVNRSSDTFSDTLLALGWAALLDKICSLLEMPDKEILIHRQNDSYKITLSCDLCIEQLISKKSISLLDPLVSEKQIARQAKKGRILQGEFAYEKQSERHKTFLQQRRNLSNPSSRRPEAIWGNDPEFAALLKTRARPELTHYQAINSMKVPDTFNELVLCWQALSVPLQWQAVHILFQLFSQRENNLEVARTTWDTLAKKQHITGHTTATAVQVINPTSGKGANTPKGNRLNSDGLDNFWLLELLKFKGFMLGAAPYVLRNGKALTPQKKGKTQKERKDRKTYVIQPQTIEFDTLSKLMEQFRLICWSTTAVKQDILAALRLTQVLIEHRRTELTIRRALEDWEDEPIVSMVRGFDVAFYKDMGSAHATMNVSTLNIPTWFPAVSTLPSVEEADALLQEHMRVIRRIQNDKGKEGGEEFDLLRIYRDFLSGHDLRQFWHFATLYGCYVFRQREHEKDVSRWLPQLSKKGLDFLVQQQPEPHFSEIINNRGFQRIASAIRESTVKAQRLHSQEHDTRYEIRYGLGLELLRKARYRSDFMIALNKFLILYNAETAREAEKAAKKHDAAKTSHPANVALPSGQNPQARRASKLRFPVSTADVTQLSALLDSYPVELVATMLISYGYCRWEPMQKSEAPTQDSLDDDLQDDAETDGEENDDNDAE